MNGSADPDLPPGGAQLDRPNPAQDPANKHPLPGLVLGVGDGLGFDGGLSPATIATVDGLDSEASRGFELRVHGVGGSSAGQILGDADAVQVGGDQTAQFIRRWRPSEVARQAHPSWPLEGYWWGGLTSRSVTRALWVLVFPLMLCNLASWMLPSPGHGPKPRQKRAGAVLPPVMRLAGYGLTLLLTASLATVSLDVFGWQCAMAQPKPSGHGHVAVCLPGWLSWTPDAAGPRLSVFALIPVIVLAVMGYASHRTLRAYERWELPDDLPRRSQSWPLTVEGFWHGLRPVRRQQLVHLAGAAGLLCVYLAAPRSSYPWVAWIAAALLVAVPAMALTCPQAGRAAVNPHREKPSASKRGPYDTVCGVIFVLSATVLAATLIAGIWWRPAIPARAPVGLLPGDSLIWLILAIAFGGLLLAASALTWMARDAAEVKRDKAFAEGFLGPLTLGLSLVSGGIFAGGLDLLVPSLLIKSPFKTTGPALAGHSSTPLVLPVPVYGFMNALLAMAAALVVLVLVGAAWFLSAARGKWQTDYLKEFYDGDIDRPGTWRQRVRIGVAWTFGEVADHAGTVVTALSLLGMAGAVAFGLVVLQPAHPGWVITTAHYGQWIGLGVAGLLLALTRQAFTSGGTRRTVGTLWDVGTFWPRASQPLAPPCYMERSVPEAVNRLRRALGDIQRRHRDGVDPATDTGELDRITNLKAELGAAAGSICLGTQDWVLVNGYSQGSPIAAAVIAQLPRELRQKVSLHTVGSPLRRLYGRAFPAYFGRRCLMELARMLGAPEPPGEIHDGQEPSKVRWRNSRRPSDYIGSYIFEDPMTSSGANAQGTCDVDRLILDPPRIIPGRATTPPPIHAHSDFWPDPQVALLTRGLIPAIAHRPLILDTGRVTADQPDHASGAAPENSPDTGSEAADSPDVVATASAYYSREINKPEAARSRAQAGFGIASAVATILITAGVIAKFQTLPVWVLSTGLAAVGLWLGTAAIFLWTVSMPIKRLPGALAQPGERETSVFVRQAVDGANYQARKINDRMRWAARASAVAAFFTLVSLVLAATIAPVDPRTDVADVSLTNTAFAVVSRICPSAVVAPSPFNIIVGAIDPNDATDEVVSLRLNSRECHGDSSIDLPRSEIRAIVANDKCSITQMALSPSGGLAAIVQVRSLNHAVSVTKPAASQTATASPAPSTLPVLPRAGRCGLYMSGEP